MPVLKDFRNSKVIVLPSFPDSKVEIYDSVLVGDMAKFSGKIEENNFEIGIKMLPLMIKSWNFTDEQGNVLPINLENLGFLKETDLLHIINSVTEFAKEGKKKD